MDLNVNYESTSSKTYSTKSTISLNDAQEKKLSGKEITNAYFAAYQKQMMEQSSATLGEQASTFRLADIGYSGKPIGELSQDEAKALVADDGFFGISQTSARIADFVVNGAGDDLSKLQAGRSGMLQGFSEAEKVWGGKLPEISYTTMQKALEKVDARIKELGGNVLDTSV
ncbi:hydrogenase-4 component G [Sulfurospirillum sp.]|uniref:hydrogenase-4 component G n=1 Tax=Sulfurospirillum sp. TaxID=2053622 RepID=UPI002FDE5B43